MTPDLRSRGHVIASCCCTPLNLQADTSLLSPPPPTLIMGLPGQESARRVIWRSMTNHNAHRSTLRDDKGLCHIQGGHLPPLTAKPPPPHHTKDFKNGSDLCLHGTYDEVGTTKYNWSAWCQYNVTGWVSIWAYDMLSQ